MTFLGRLAAVVAAFLLGGIPFGYLLVKWKTGGDVRASGSGNIGATNVFRTQGRLIGVLTLLLDGGKGWLAVYLAARVSDGDALWLSAAAVAVILGHVYTPFLGFKGGKGVATFTGAFLYVAPVTLAAVAVIFMLTVWYTRHLSLGSIMGALTFPLGVWLIEKPPVTVVVAALVSCGVMLYRHRENIERLRAGTERTFSLSSHKQ
jgi:glycerol-3-phosphate acyltransferase PlsY